MTNEKMYYTATVRRDMEGIEAIYVRKGRDLGQGEIDYQHVDREQLVGIASDLESRLNETDVWRAFVREIASGEMSGESMVAEAKEMLLRQGDEL